MHSREHVVFNRQAEDAGFDIASTEDRARRTIAWAKRRSPIQQLAATCALEHFTATLAHDALANPTHLGGAAEEARQLWRWHAIEERSEEHTSELQSLMRISYAVFCLKTKKK